MRQGTEWGLPDWTKPVGYPAPPVHICDWAWEFLRRWRDYREFWEDKIQPFVGVRGCISCDSAGIFWPYRDELKARFGVEHPSSPDSAMPAHFTAECIHWLPNDGREFQQIQLKEHEIVIHFDLERPLKQQVERARKVAERERKYLQDAGKIGLRTARSRAEHYVRYLRILDGYEACARPKEIANLLFEDLPAPPENDRLKALHDDRIVARQLRDGGYRSLLEAK